MKHDQDKIHSSYGVLKKVLPAKVCEWIRALANAFLTPILFSHMSGHFKSSLSQKAVSVEGKAIPWYTYPVIDFLRSKDFKDKIVLEFGGGQSTIWWGERAKKVITFEGNKIWYEELKRMVLSNTEVHLVTMESQEKCISEIREQLRKNEIKSYDIIIIDGLYRENLTDVACEFVSSDGVIICDNFESYDYSRLKNYPFKRVDFWGHAPGVIQAHCASIFF